jgi:hypothetical protein
MLAMMAPDTGPLGQQVCNLFPPRQFRSWYAPKFAARDNNPNYSGVPSIIFPNQLIIIGLSNRNIPRLPAFHPLWRDRLRSVSIYTARSV